MKEFFKNVFFRIWYGYISSVDKNAEVVFMNYGYSKKGEELNLEGADEKNRYSVQLYHKTATGIDVAGKDLLEVGCGRGGGLSYVSRNLSPENITGIDLNKKAIKFCNKNYKAKNAVFLQADAQKLPLKDNSFDAVLNVESSHRYPQPELFFDEVYRVLKPDGSFLFTDFRFEHEIEEMEAKLVKSNFNIVKKQDITPNVVEALKLATPDREKLVKKLIPSFLQDLGRNFAATEGSPTYNKFATGKYSYCVYLLQKNN